MTQEHLKILRAAVAAELPRTVNRDTPGIDVAAVRELCDAGLIDASIFRAVAEGDSFADVKITLAGREYLSRLEEAEADHASQPAENPADTPGKPSKVVDLALKVLAGLLVLAVAFALKHYGILTL